MPPSKKKGSKKIEFLKKLISRENINLLIALIALIVSIIAINQTNTANKKQFEDDFEIVNTTLGNIYDLQIIPIPDYDQNKNKFKYLTNYLLFQKHNIDIYNKGLKPIIIKNLKVLCNNKEHLQSFIKPNPPYSLDPAKIISIEVEIYLGMPDDIIKKFIKDYYASTPQLKLVLDDIIFDPRHEMFTRDPKFKKLIKTRYQCNFSLEITSANNIIKKLPLETEIIEFDFIQKLRQIK